MFDKLQVGVQPTKELLGAEVWRSLYTLSPTPADMEVRRLFLARVIELRGPDKFAMATWISDVSDDDAASAIAASPTWCGTPACVAGTAALALLDLNMVDPPEPELAHRGEVWMDWVDGPGLDGVQSWLGLTLNACLFHRSEWAVYVDHVTQTQFVRDYSSEVFEWAMAVALLEHFDTAPWWPNAIAYGSEIALRVERLCESIGVVGSCG